MRTICKRWRPLLSAFHDGELPEDQASSLRAHLDSCAACREELASIREVADLLSARTAPDPYFVARFRARRAKQSSPLPWSWRTLALRLLPLSLAALIGAGLAVWMSLERNGFGELESGVLGPVAFENVAGVDPVLGIALESSSEAEH